MLDHQTANTLALFRIGNGISSQHALKPRTHGSQHTAPQAQAIKQDLNAVSGNLLIQGYGEVPKAKTRINIPRKGAGIRTDTGKAVVRINIFFRQFDNKQTKFSAVLPFSGNNRSQAAMGGTGDIQFILCTFGIESPALCLLIKLDPGLYPFGINPDTNFSQGKSNQPALRYLR